MKTRSHNPLATAIGCWLPALGYQPPATSQRPSFTYFSFFFLMGSSSVVFIYLLSCIKEVNTLGGSFSACELGTKVPTSRVLKQSSYIIISNNSTQWNFVRVRAGVYDNTSPVSCHPFYRVYHWSSATGHPPCSFSIPLFIFAFVPSSICDLQMISQPVGSFRHTFHHIFSTATFRDLQGFRIQRNPFVIFTFYLSDLFVIKTLKIRSRSSPSPGQLLSELLPGLSEAGIRTPMSSTVYLKQL